MIKINNILNVRPFFKGNVQKEQENTPNSFASNPITASYSDAISSYGKAQIAFSGKIEEDSQKIEDDNISLDDAILELSKIRSMTTKKMVDCIMACTYDTDSPDVLINRKALSYIKNDLAYGPLVPKYLDAVRTCIDDENHRFDDVKFNNLFNINGRVKISARLTSANRYITGGANAQRRIKVFDAVQNSGLFESEVKKVTLTKEDLFTPIQDVANKLINELEALKENSDISEDLYTALKGHLNDNNFDLNEAYNSHYSLLADCKSLEDVKELYPDIKFPDKPQPNSGPSRVSLKNRLAQEDYDAVTLDIIKRIYLDLELPNQNMIVALPNDQSTTTMFALKRAGFDYSAPSDGLKQLLKNASEIQEKYQAIEKMDVEVLEKYVNKHAIHQGGIWDDYTNLTKKHWFPIKLINSKEKNPEVSKYRTDKLVDTYLYGLYKLGFNPADSNNPLKEFDNQKHLSPKIFDIITRIYITKYKEDDTRKYDYEFEHYKNKFDKEAIGKSIENMEQLYKKVFFGKYWNSERVAKLKEQLQNSYDLVFEKIGTTSNVSSKTVTDKDIENIVSKEIEEYNPKIAQKDIGKFKFMISNIKDLSLRERCQTCVSNTDSVDIGYFNTMFNIIEKSYNQTGKKLDENKAKVLIYLHDKYMSEVLTSDVQENEEEYINRNLAPYKQLNGKIDYAKADNNIIEPSIFEQLSLRMIDDGNEDIVSVMEEKFLKRDDGADYTMANSVLQSYFSLPDCFKELYINKLKEFGHTNKFIIFNETKALFDKISSWNFDKDEEIIMDKDKLPQKVVIEQKAKQDLWELTGKNIEVYDRYWNSFCKAAERRTSKKGGSGIKSLDESSADYDIELKIKGKSKSLRMFPREITADDKLKYEKEDGIKLKYIFASCGYHL